MAKEVRQPDQDLEREQTGSNYAAFLKLARDLDQKGILSLKFSPHAEYDRNHSVQVCDCMGGLEQYWDLLKGSDEWYVQVMNYDESVNGDPFASLILENRSGERMIFMLDHRFDTYQLQVLATRRLEGVDGRIKSLQANLEGQSESRISGFILELGRIYGKNADQTTGAKLSRMPEIAGPLGIRTAKSRLVGSSLRR